MHTKFWSENPEGKRPRGKQRRRWEDNTSMDLTRKWMGSCGIHSSEDSDQRQALVNTVMNLRVP